MDLIELKDERLSYLIDSEIVPLAPGSVVPKIFLSVLTINSLDLFEFFHKLKVNGLDYTGFSKAGLSQGGSFWKLNINSNEKVREQLNIQKLAPGRAQIKHELIKHLLIDFDSQQLKSVVGVHSQQDTQILLSIGERLDVDRVELLFKKSAEILVCYLLATACRHHSFVGKAFSYLFYPVI